METGLFESNGESRVLATMVGTFQKELRGWVGKGSRCKGTVPKKEMEVTPCRDVILTD